MCECVHVFVQVLVDDVVVETLRPDVYNESLLLDDLRPSTDYLFQAVVGNALGMADPLMSNASTPIGERGIEGGGGEGGWYL